MALELLTTMRAQFELAGIDRWIGHLVGRNTLEGTALPAASGAASLALASVRRLPRRLFPGSVEPERRSTDERLLLATELAEVGLWEWEIAGNRIHWNKTTARICGRDGTASVSPHEWMETVHPSDRGEVESTLHTMLQDGKAAGVEFRLLRPDGSVRFLSLAGGAVYDADGIDPRVVCIVKDITGRNVSAARVSHLTHHDSLTGLPNRELLHDRLSVCLERAKRYRTTLGILLIDLDSFKRINDAHGHLAGDEVLRIVAARLKAQFRAVDTVARIGGDEFLALLPDLRSESDAHRLGIKALQAICEPMTVGGHELNVTASAGIALYPESAEELEMLIHSADTAMYAAKADGKNKVKSFTKELVETTARRARMEDALRHAIRNGELQLVYQPQVCLASSTVTGVEALIRWHSPIFGTVMPMDFIGLAEETGLIVPIGEWVLRTACRDAVAINRLAGRPVSMAVNLSPRQFQQEDLAELIERTLTETGLAPGLLELEITEGMLMSDSIDAAAILNRIRDLGVRLSLDDFGTGFSSMSYIIKFHVDRLKVDRSFIKDSTTDPSCRTVTKAIIGLAQDLKIAVVAEGVETEEQRRFLLRQGCDDAQGYLFSKPKSLAELTSAIREIEQAVHSASSGIRAAYVPQLSSAPA